LVSVVSLEDFPKRAKLVKRDDRYEVYDLAMEHLVASITVLHPGKATTGHSHSDAEEVYYYARGEGEILLGRNRHKVKAGDVLLIPMATFHRVYNTGSEDMVFLSVFEKYEDRK
jgi:oxalate decarboxylase/phosphoglucose isomerase-like protein (cupin superfamily)